MSQAKQVDNKVQVNKIYFKIDNVIWNLQEHILAAYSFR